MKEINQKRSFPLPVYYWTIAALAFIGLLTSIYLSISHYRVYTDIVYESFCAISRAVNCDTVSQSPYSIMLGVPVPVWGVMGYSFFLALLLFAKNALIEEKRIWSCLIVISGVFSLCSITLAMISIFVIHSYCIMCIITYGVDFLLLYYTWITRQRFKPGKLFADGLKKDADFLKTKKLKIILFLLPFILASVSAMTFIPDYWHLRPPALSADIPTGVTSKGYPWIGAEKPELVITEFTDYLCFQCKKMNFFLRELIEKYPNKIRLINRQFPMDNKFNPMVKQPFHIGAGNLALIAEYAKFKGKFWQMNDLLYQLMGQKTIDLRKIAKKLNLDYRWLAVVDRIPELRYSLKHDIATGIKLGITGTPGFIINGKVYQGQIPPEIIRKVTGGE